MTISVLFAVRKALWGYVFIPLFLITGARCALSMKKAFRPRLKKDKITLKRKDDAAVKPYQALFANLASTLGTGNITGVALALAAGGAGSVFWMWVAGLFGMCVSFWENTLGVKTRGRNDYPAPYMKRRAAKVFSFCCILASFGMGNMAQANSAAISAKNAFHAPPVFSGILLALLTALIILKGLSGILRFTDRFVPFMSAFYILFSLGVIIINKDALPGVFRAIFTEAFSARAFFGGGAAAGIARGIFSGEAGLGSAVILGSQSGAKRPEEQGFIGMACIFTDTFLICTLTALSCLSSGCVSAAGAFYSSFGAFGEKTLDLSVVFFAFTSIVGWSYYGGVCARFLFGERGERLYKAIFIFFTFLGCVLKMDAVWAISDIFNAVMAVPNMGAICKKIGEEF